LPLAIGGAWDDGLCSESGSALEGVWFESGETLSCAAVGGFPLLCSPGSTTPRLTGVCDDTPPPVTTWRSLGGIPRGVRVRLDVSVGAGGTRGGEKEDMEKLCRRKAGEETEDDDLRGDWAEGVRWTWPATRGICAVLSRRDCLLGRGELDDEIWSGPVTPPLCCVSES
jgi:hypothetical protein